MEAGGSVQEPEHPKRDAAVEAVLDTAPDEDAPLAPRQLLGNLPAPGSRTLATEAHTASEDGRGMVLASAASVWELTIKSALGKLDAPSDYLAMLANYRFVPLDITSDHALALSELPHYHRDPYDRMLIGQARTEGLTLVTYDRALSAYDVAVMMAPE